jgi:hypothetical protein
MMRVCADIFAEFSMAVAATDAAAIISPPRFDVYADAMSRFRQPPPFSTLFEDAISPPISAPLIRHCATLFDDDAAMLFRLLFI